MRHRPDVVLLDLHMPYLDGLQVMAALSEVIDDDDFVPIVILTADATPTAREEALGAGAKDFLTKPFDNTEVVLRVKNLLESRLLYLGLRDENAELAERLRIGDTNDRALDEERGAQVSRVEQALRPESRSTVFQPIVELGTERRRRRRGADPVRDRTTSQPRRVVP